MFDFRVFNTADGNQVIDRSLKTLCNTLTPLQMVGYLEIDSQLAYMDRLGRKARAEAEHRRKISSNPLYRLAHLCRVIRFAYRQMGKKGCLK